MSDEHELVPQEKAQLIPPTRRPPTAVGAGTPEPPDLPGPRHHVRGRNPLVMAFGALRGALSLGLDVVDALVDPLVAWLHGPPRSAGQRR